MSSASEQDGSNTEAVLLFRAVIKLGETAWPRERVNLARSRKIKQTDGSQRKPYADARRVRMLVVSERSPETRGMFSSAIDAAVYDEYLLFTQRAHFSLINDAERGGHGKADLRGARLGKEAAAKECHQQAMLARLDAFLAAPVYIDEKKVC